MIVRDAPPFKVRETRLPYVAKAGTVAPVERRMPKPRRFRVTETTRTNLVTYPERSAAKPRRTRRPTPPASKVAVPVSTLHDRPKDRHSEKRKDREAVCKERPTPTGKRGGGSRAFVPWCK